MNSFLYIFPFVFIGIIGMVILFSYVVSKMGWNALVEKFKATNEFEGTRLGITSLNINSANYQNSMVLKYNYQGIYLRPVFIFRLFHPPVLIPWNEIKQVRDKKIFFVNLKELVIGDPFIALITLKASTYNKIEKPFEYSSKL